MELCSELDAVRNQGQFHDSSQRSGDDFLVTHPMFLYVQLVSLVYLSIPE